MTRTDLDHRLLEHRYIWEKKPSLRAVYEDYHSRLLQACPSGRILDIGGGSGHAKDFNKNIISADILPFPGLDVACDAHYLPFSDASFSGIVMLDVLHHLVNPVVFLNEASRVLAPGGVLAMIEPGMSAVSTPFYKYLHQEPVDFKVDPFTHIIPSKDKDPFDSNQALPTLFFSDGKNADRLNNILPNLHISKVDWLSLFAYPLSGGFKPWSLIPSTLVPSVISVEDNLPAFIKKLMGFRILIEMKKK